MQIHDCGRAFEMMLGHTHFITLEMYYTNRRALREKRALARLFRQEATPEEKILWRRLRTHKLEGFHFRRQHVLAGFIVDFYCWKGHLIVELDGKHHDDQRKQMNTGMPSCAGWVTRSFDSPMQGSETKSATYWIRSRKSYPEEPDPSYPLPPSGEGGQGVGVGRGQRL